ncbi:MAG: alpha/beta hydrolase, partial [Gammaproteobacteria bacterium]
IEPAHYNPEIGVTYNIKNATIRASLNFPDLPAPPETDAFKQLAKRDPFEAYANRLRQWLPSVSRERVAGTVLLLPGFGLDKNSLISWALFFADRGWRAVLIDLRGQGASESPYLTWGIRDSDDLHRLVSLLEHRGILQTPWLYFGVSYGAGIALMAGPGSPRPNGIIAIAPWGNADKVIPRFGKAAGGWLAPSAASPKWVMAENIAGKLAGINLSEAVPAKSVTMIQAPVLYLGGESDKIATPSEIKELYQMTPEATLKLVPGMPHIVVSADVPGFCQAIVDWLEHTVRQPYQRRCAIRRTITKDAMEATYFGAVPRP